MPWRRKWKKRSKRRKNMGICSGIRGIRKWGGSPWGPGKGPKEIWNFFLEKSIGDVWWKYVLSRWRRGDWYILLRNVGKILQHVVRTPPSWRILVMVDFECWVCVCVCDDVKRDWLQWGMFLLVSIRRDAIGGACVGLRGLKRVAVMSIVRRGV